MSAHNTQILNLTTNHGTAASPGYFTTTFVNDIKLETTSTRRAGLIRFTYPPSAGSGFVVVDLTHDLQRSFEGGSLSLDASVGRVELSGTFLQVSFPLYVTPLDLICLSLELRNR